MARSGERTSKARRRGGAPVPVRRIVLDLDDGIPAAWNPANPAFAAAANTVSLLMPYAEPYFVRSVRDALPDLEPALAERASAFARQEGQHHRQHRRLNDVIVAQVPRLVRPERRIEKVYGWLGRTRSARFNLAFAAASEAGAFALARWSVRNQAAFFADADPRAATLFMWHLAEEVEHRSVAFDVWADRDGSRLRYAWATVATVAILAFFTAWCVPVMLSRQKLLRRPRTWARLARLAVSFAFHVLPDMAAACLPGHHPDELTEPPWLRAWLATYDPATRTIPAWTSAGRHAGPSPEPAAPLAG